MLDMVVRNRVVDTGVVSIINEVEQHLKLLN